MKIKKRILLLGSTGMLGSAIYGVLKDKYHIINTSRNIDKFNLLEKKYGGTQHHELMQFDVSIMYKDYVEKRGGPGSYFNALIDKIGDVDYVINAIGVTIPYSLENPAMTFFVNSALPHILANFFKEKLMHITTDCVFDGKAGYPYSETSVKTPVDIYGLSKSLGEPTCCLTIRTSIIGRELANFTGLLEWFLSQRGKTVTGYTNHLWNGITTHQFGVICGQIFSNPDNFPKSGLFHVFSSSISKYDMLKKFEKKYQIDCTIIPTESTPINRTLTTDKNLNKLLNIPSFDEMLGQL